MTFYDDTKPSKCMMYLDVNNLYGWAMSRYFPCSEFKWLNQKEIDKFDVNAMNDLEVDLEYPDEFHELHNDYPLAPETISN